MAAGVGGCRWPLPPHSSSRRVRARYNRLLSLRRLENSVIQSLNTLSASFAHDSDSSILPDLASQLSSDAAGPHRRSVSGAAGSHRRSAHRDGPHSVHAVQSRLLGNVSHACRRFAARRQGSSPCGSNPAASHGSGPRCASAAVSPTPNDFNYSSARSFAVPLTAERASLPQIAGTLPLTSLLPPAMAVRYASPDSLLRPPAEVERAARAVLCASRHDYIGVIKRLSDIGMLAWTRTPAAVNGIFGVPKEPGQPDTPLRLIIDARAANARFVDPPHVDLPTPDIVGRITVPAGQPLYLAKVDISDFYHRILMPEAWWPYFALPYLTAAECTTASITIAPFGTAVHARRMSPTERWFPCVRTLPMGFSHAVPLAQALHEHFLDTQTGLCREERITATSPLRVDRIRHCVYIDDLTLFGTDPEAMRVMQQAYIAAAAAVGLHAKMSKVVPPTHCTETIGLEFDGRELTVGVSAAKLQRLCDDTQVILNARYCTGERLARIVGRWTWAMLVRRPALSTFSSVYRFIESAGRAAFALWPSVARELRVAIGLAPLLFASIAEGWCPQVVASDASSLGQGVVAAPVAHAVVAEVARDRAMPGSADPERWRPQAERSAVAAAAVRPAPPAALAGSKWTTIVSSRWERDEHINSYELRAAVTAVRWVLSSPSAMNSRLLLLCDSSAVVGALTKGRSSSVLLLRRCRRMAAWLLASGLRLFVRWVPSEWNPADGPSRLC